MHRSGTSFLTEALSHLGAALPKSISPAAEDNLRGHFESKKFVDFHENLLNRYNEYWHSVNYENLISRMSNDDKCEAIRTIKEILVEDYETLSFILLKDPRVSLVLPLWEELLKQEEGLESYFVIALRHPFEIASSLFKRNKFSITRSLMIYLNYLLKIENNTRNKKRGFLNYPSWIKEPSKSIIKLEKELGIQFKHKFEEVKEVFDQNLQHEKVDEVICDTYIKSLSLRLHEQLLKLSKRDNDPACYYEIDKINEDFMKYSGDLKDYNQELGDLTFNCSEFQNKLKLKNIEISDLKIQFDEKESFLRQENIELKKKNDELYEKLSNLSDSCEKLVNLNEQVNENHERLIKEHQQLSIDYQHERKTVIRPVYRNIYKGVGLLLRKTIPTKYVEKLKKVTPNPDGVPLKLVYKHKNQSPKVNQNEHFKTRGIDSEPDVFVLSIINYNFRIQRPQHLSRGLVNSNRRVFYVEMELCDQGLWIDKIEENFFKVRLSMKRVGHIQPYSGRPDLLQTKKWINAFFDLCDKVKATSFKQIIVEHPFWWQLVSHLSPEYEIIFDCMDDISCFSNTEPFLIDLEKKLLSESDKLIVSSQHLYNKYRQFQEPTLIRNAADVIHFYNYVNKDIENKNYKFRRESDGEKIHVGYVGAIAEWFDVDLLRDAANANKDIVYHLCGAVSAKKPTELEKVDNITMHGEIDYADVPRFLKEMDVLTIPFQLTPIIQACDPVKFYEYSAMGKPTVTTRLPELKRASHLAFFVDSSEEFVFQIHKAYEKIADEEFIDSLKTFALENTWSHRAEAFLEQLKKHPLVSIVILSYGDASLTKATLTSLFNGGKSYPNMEILVVDNGSNEENLKEIYQHAEKLCDIRIIENKENFGFAKGNNVGLKQVKGEYVLLLNNDTFVAPGAIYSMVRHLKQNPKAGAVGPLTNNIGNEAKLFVEYRNMDEMVKVARDVTLGYRGSCTKIRVVAYFAVMFRTSNLSEFGLLNEDYQRGMFEDDDHCKMINSKGYNCILAEDSFIHHHLSATFSQINQEEKDELFERNKKIFEKRWGDWIPHQYREIRPGSSLSHSKFLDA